MRVSRALRFACLCAALAAPGCALFASGPTYSAEEFRALSNCVGLSNLALGVGAVKLMGASAMQVKDTYAKGSEQPVPVEVTNQVIDAVYGTQADSPYGYSQAYFGGCAEQMAKVPHERVAVATQCMSRSNMALAATIAKQQGRSQELTVSKLTEYGVPETPQIVDRVYTGTADGDEAQMFEWKTCMAPYHES